MINVVIVEDEMLVRLGIKMCVDEHSTAMRVVAAFSNAEEAMNYFDENSADVLITDIRLINKSGLELVEYVKPKIPDLITIILSCYEDFSYARRAYELGADRYLLKHEINSEELPKIIEEAISKKLLSKKEQHIEDNKISLKKFIPNSGVQYKVCSIGLRNQEERRFVDSNEISFPMVTEIIQEVLNINHLGECYLRHEDEIFCILCFSINDAEATMISQTNAFFRQIQTNLKNIFEKEVYLSLSETFENLSDVPDYFKKSLRFLSYSFYYETSQIIYNNHITENKESLVFHYPIENIFKNDGMSDFTVYLHQYFIKQGEAFVAVEEVKLQLVKFMHDFSQYIEKYYRIDINLELEDEYKLNYVNIEGFYFAIPLEQWIQEVVRTVREFIYERDKNHGSISDIIRYIEKNYQNEINLDILSKEFHMNKVYICQLFKKETGDTLINYLNHYRIEQAKILLKESNDTEEVSRKVGIENVNYFIRLFKKITNETISEFKNKRETKYCEHS